ncbi:hypothetical protein PVAND_007080 [Polypedilum vanderplanki]|uniref:Uncharacterized protein n=1 Tax=Polypedilum vanderplanki TaxID=319348 RepID=A0A9J6C5P9_POLVA|nr:hypothetical protein PVAND_007080 [Polypedilum vanderplanki]
MDQSFIDREKELFKLNAKLNAKSKKIDPSSIIAAATSSTLSISTTTKIKGKTVQIHTTNSNFNYYEEQPSDEQQQQKHLELMCKKMNITNQPVKKPQEIVYPLFNRHAHKQQQISRRVDIHMPNASLMSDGNADAEETDIKSIKTETAVDSFKNESLLTHCTDESSAVPPVDPIIPHILNMPLPPPPNSTDIIPKCIEKKISNDGLLKFLKSKVVLLQTELENTQRHNDTLEKENTKQSKKVKKLTGQLDKANSKLESLESSLKSLQEKNAEHEQSLKDKDAIISELNRELSTMKEELRELNHNHQVMEKRMLKTQEDHDMMKSKYESYKDIEIIMRESAKEEKIAYEEKIKKLRKGRLDLLKAYKQNIILIDNLRRQNLCLEKAKALEIAEKEFLKVLDWNFTDK